MDLYEEIEQRKLSRIASCPNAEYCDPNKCTGFPRFCPCRSQTGEETNQLISNHLNSEECKQAMDAFYKDIAAWRRNGGKIG